MFSRIDFIITEAFMSLRRHPAMAFAAIGCIAASLFLSGFIILFILNAGHAVNRQIDRVRFGVYFHPETSRQEAWGAYKRIVKLDNVAQADFIAREKGWAKLVKDDPQLAKLVNKNPLPDSVMVKANDVTQITMLKKELETWPEVARVQTPTKVSTVLATFRRAVSSVGLTAGIIFAVLSLVIIHHTIELTLYARRKELQIMTLVGASPGTVAMPFLLEGVVYGVFGGIVAFAALFFSYQFAVSSLRSVYGASLLGTSLLLTHGWVVILGLGAVLGCLGSAISVTKYLNRPRSKMTNA